SHQRRPHPGKRVSLQPPNVWHEIHTTLPGSLMNLKTAIVSVLDRDDLKRLLDALDIDGVDRRNIQAMRLAITGSRRVSPETLLESLPKQNIQQVCDTLGLSRSGGRAELVERLLGNGKQARPAVQRSTKMAQEEQSANGCLVPTAPVTKKPPK